MAVHPSPPPPERPVQLDLDSAGVPDVVRALCQATGHGRFAMSPDVVGSDKRLTFSVSGSASEVWRDGLETLRLAGVGGSCARSGLCSFQNLPPAKEAIAMSVVSYEPVHRDVAFLGGAMAGMFGGWHFAGLQSSGSQQAAQAVSASSGSGGSGGPSQGRATPSEASPARLVGVGPSEDRERVLSVLRTLDAPVQPVVVHLAVYEVDTSSSDASAIQLVGKVLGATLQVGADAATQSLVSTGTASLSYNSQRFQAVVGALDSSSVAHLVTAPVLRTSSGVMASFAVGDSVPTLASVSYSQGSSTPIQSIQYQQSGVVFSVVPQIIGESVDVAVYQSISSFAATTVGVTSSPTLSNRALSSDLVVRPGGVVVLGGLMQTSDAHGASGWWFLPELSKTKSRSRSELVLVLSVELAGL